MKISYKKVGKSEGHEYRFNLEHQHSSGRVEKEVVTLYTLNEEHAIELLAAILGVHEESTQIVLQFPKESVSISLKPDELIEGQMAKLRIHGIQYFYCDCEYKVTYTGA